MKRSPKNRICRFKSASFTVETALLMPLVLLVLTAAIMLCFFIAGRSVCTARACEQAVTGRDAEFPAPCGITDIRRAAEDKKSSRTVRFEGGTFPETGLFAWRFDTEAVYRKYYPAQWIRRLRAARDLFTPDD